jgi:hypothetical protein
MLPPGVDNVLYIAGNECNYSDAPGRQHRLQCTRNGTTDKDVRTQIRQLLGFLKRLVASEQYRGLGDHPACRR